MGVYYYLINDTKREVVHWDHHVKRGPMEGNPQVHHALVNYMLENLGDSMMMLSDAGSWDEKYDDEYAWVDLSRPRTSAT